MQALYLSHNGMTEALGQRQVLPYLRGLSESGVSITLLCCEPPSADPVQIDQVRRDLLGWDIRYTPLRRRPSHGLADKVLDCARLFLTALQRVRAEGLRPRVIHARSHLPSAVARALGTALRGSQVIFDCRGLLAEEYADLGHWRRGDFRYRLTGAAEWRLLHRADRVVVLTEALRQELCGPEGPLAGRADDVTVIPCCVDMERFRPDEDARRRSREALDLPQEAPLLVFAGSLSRYDLPATARLLAALRRRSDTRLLLLTGDDPQRFFAALSEAGCADAVYLRRSAPRDVPGWLAGGDLAVSLLRDCRSSIAASPTKVAEALAAGLPTAVSQNIAWNNRLSGPGLWPVSLDDQTAMDRLADSLLSQLSHPQAARAAARQTAMHFFSLASVGVARYRALYEQLS